MDIEDLSTKKWKGWISIHRKGWLSLERIPGGDSDEPLARSSVYEFTLRPSSDEWKVAETELCRLWHNQGGVLECASGFSGNSSLRVYAMLVVTYGGLALTHEFPLYIDKGDTNNSQDSDPHVDDEVAHVTHEDSIADLSVGGSISNLGAV